MENARARPLAATLSALAFGNPASAFASHDTTLPVIRLIMLSLGALYTLRAACTAARRPENRRNDVV